LEHLVFSFVCCNKYWTPTFFWIICLPFHLPRTLCFSLLSFNECSLFLELRLALVFLPWFLLWYCFIFISRCIFTSGHVGLHQKSCFKKVRMVLEKWKNFMQKSGTKRSLFRLWLRILHVVLDIVLIVCLVIFSVALLVSND
jgi:hypothetical protein